MVSAGAPGSTRTLRGPRLVASSAPAARGTCTHHLLCRAGAPEPPECKIHGCALFRLAQSSNPGHASEVSITVIKEGATLRILECSEEIPEGTRLVLQPFKQPSAAGNALEYAQLESFLHQPDDDWGCELDPLTL